ncbi:MAG TPA: PA14 domain-containing protein, partial [Chitinophagaceae bacterium]
MKKLLLLTGSLCLFTACNTFAQPNVFDPADPIVYYPSSVPTTNWGNIQKWVVTDRNLGWNTSSYKAYHLNGVSFRLKYPKTYQHNVADGRKYPIMIFWHGAGEKGWLYDNETHLVHGGEIFRDRVDNGVFDGFVLYPQNSGGYFDNSHFEILLKVVDSLAKYCKLDVDRVLVNGASAGGDACFNITATYPHRITKATPSAAAPASAIPYVSNFVHVPVWFASGGLDVNPTLAMAQRMYDSLKNRGADVKWTLYPDRGHYIWISHWFEPGYDEYINDMHKANPLVFFQRNLFCPDSPTITKMGLSPGFFAYEWQVNTGAGYTNIAGATLNEYTATAYGTYRVRFKRSSTASWSEWSPSPVVVGPKTTTITPAIGIKGLRSKVLPAPDGSTSVPLRLPPGYTGYEYWRTDDNLLVGTDSIYNATPGTYKARVKEAFGCNAFFSPDFTVVAANGFNKPHPAKNLTAFAPNQTSIQLDWSDNPAPAFDETGFEIYRAEQAGGPYTLIAINSPNILSYLDQNLPPNTGFFYIVRAVNNSSAASNSNEASAKTKADIEPPTAPGNLRHTLAGRFSVSLAWDASTDDAGVAHYDIYVNGTKRYTTEGTSFTVNELDSFQRHTFAVRAKDIRGNQSPFSNQINVTTRNQGFFYQYYEGTWTALPDFDNLSPVLETGNTSNIDLTVRNRNDNFAFIWRGFITVPTTATYTFETCSDEGSKLYVNMPYNHNAVPTVSNDLIHVTTCQTGSVALVAGLSYPITATFFEATGGEAMQLYWRNNAGLARQLIPNSALNDSYTAPGTAPTAPSGLAAISTGYNRIVLSWNDNSNNESGFEIVRATAAAGPFVNIGNTGAGINNYTDSTLNASTTYWFKVRAIGATGESAFSTAASATTQAPLTIPGAPTLLTMEVMSASVISLGWNDNSANETLFEIYRSTSNNSNFRLITT